MKNLTAIVIFLALLSGCAIGNQYDYQSTDIELPVTGSSELGVLVVDRRPYVLNGEKAANYVGVQRGGYGNPFNVTTKSGNPLALEMQNAIVQELQEKGYQATGLEIETADDSAIDQAVTAHGAPRNILLLLDEWMTDAMMRFGLSYDVTLQITNQDNALLAQNSSDGHKEVLSGAGFGRPEFQNSRRRLRAKAQNHVQ